MSATNQFIQDFVQGDHECRGSIEACAVVGNGECIVCGARDCPHGEPLHHHHDGCPQCCMETAETIIDDLAGCPKRLIDYVREHGVPSGYPLTIGTPIDKQPSDAVLLQKAENEKRSWLRVCSKIIAEDQEKLAIAIEALKFYSENEVYAYPDGWNCMKEGGHPGIDDYDRVDGVADKALAQIEAVGK